MSAAEREDRRRELPSVVLQGPGEPCLVLGRPKPALRTDEYRAVQALLAAYPTALTRAALERIAGSAAHGALVRLRKKDTRWSEAIRMPGRRGDGGYRLSQA
ncbi:MAG: hypothetical protein ACE5F9_09135 [Phycisphaerae bacterium]